MAELTPLVLRDAPSLIEAVFPAQKVSFEAQRERKAGAGQTLTALGSYWKGRKPLILVRAIVLGSLLPQTENIEKDLEIFEKLMAFDDDGLARRALAQNKLPTKEIAARISLSNPWDFFDYSRRPTDVDLETVSRMRFPLDSDAENISLRWKRNISEHDKLTIWGKVLVTFSGYEERAALCKRPEEVDRAWLFTSVWPVVNAHYAHLGISAQSHEELVEQLGILRYGHRPIVGDTFAGGGSIPFEASRLGCNTFASDLNPIACMLAWGAVNIIGAPLDRRAKIEQDQQEVAEAVDREIANLGIEHDAEGNRAKIYFYCQETRCPQTGWSIPMSPSWVISKQRNVVAELTADYDEKRFDIEIRSGVRADEMRLADRGTIQDGALVYELKGVTYRTPIATLRGDYRDADGNSKSRLRRWTKSDFKPASDDIFQERLYGIQWITKNTLNQSRKETFFAAVTESDLEREQQVEAIVKENLACWQTEGLVPDMEIESGYNTDQPIRERGWTHWHHLFTARDLLFFRYWREFNKPSNAIELCRLLDRTSRLCGWVTTRNREAPSNVFANQALNTLYDYCNYSAYELIRLSADTLRFSDPINTQSTIRSAQAATITDHCDLFITDPPYADAVHYHEITEFFIAWLRRHPPEEFVQWTWDSRRALAIKGTGDDFRRGMVDAYSAMAEHMPDNGLQCVMFTHQDTGVWSDMAGIFWAAGLQVVAAWYIATETTSELKKGGYVQGTVILILRKRPAGEKSGFKQRILPAVRNEVTRQIEQMMHLNDEVEQKLGEPVFNDSDLQMAGYAAALKVLTAYTHIGGDDVTSFALRPRQRGEVTVVDEIVQQAAEAANSLLVPDGLAADTWQRISGIQRFYLRMVDMETTGASKLDNYQNFAKAFRVDDYVKAMGNMTANKARLKRVSEFKSRDLTDSTELGATWLGRLIIGLQQLVADTEPQVVISQLQMELPDFMEVRPLLIDMLQFLQTKAPEEEVRNTAEVLANRLRNLRALGQ